VDTYLGKNWLIWVYSQYNSAFPRFYPHHLISLEPQEELDWFSW